MQIVRLRREVCHKVFLFVTFVRIIRELQFEYHNIGANGGNRYASVRLTEKQYQRLRVTLEWKGPAVIKTFDIEVQEFALRDA